MTKQKPTSFVEQIDKMHQRIAIGVFLMAIAYAISVIRFLVSEEMNGILDTTSRVLGITIFILVLPAFLKFVNMRRKNRRACKEPEGFVIEMFNKATGKAFQFTFLFLVALEFMSSSYLTQLPGEFFIKLIISVTLAIFSLTFFLLNRAGDVGETEDDFANGGNL
jgi:hypothetical protein